MPEKSTATSPRIGDLTKRLQREPGSRVFYELAREHHSAGNLDDALKLCRDGLLKHPAYHSARVLLGRVLIDLKQYGSARPELEQVVRQAPDNLLARRLLAEALAGDNDVRGALTALRALVLLHPEDEESALRIKDLEAEAGRRSAEGMETLPGASPSPAASEPKPPAAEELAVATVTFRYEPPSSKESELEEPAVEASSESFMPSETAGAGQEEDRRPEASVATVLMAVPIFASPEASQEAASSTILGEAASEVAPALETAPSPPMSAEDEPTLGALPTPTLAEIYLAQGMADQALEIYKQVLAGDPQNHEALARIRELSAKLPPSGSLTQRKIQVLEGWLERIRRRHDVQDDAGRSGPTSAGM